MISDYAAIDQISPDYKTDVKTGVNAGLDMIMVPNKYADVRQRPDAPGQQRRRHARPASTTRCQRILTQKFQLGLFDHPFADRTNIGTIGSPAHRAVARQAAAESQVLLKNAHNVLPLARSAKIYVAGSQRRRRRQPDRRLDADLAGPVRRRSPGDTSILQGMRQVAPHASITYSQDASAPTSGYNVGVVVVGETPYAEGMGDVGNNGHTLQLSTADRNAVDTVCAAMKCVVLVVSGRPLDITGIVPEADAVVASWLPGIGGRRRCRRPVRREARSPGGCP